MGLNEQGVGVFSPGDVLRTKLQGLPRCLSGKESACQCRRRRRCGFDPWVGKILGGGNGNPFQYSCLENPMDRRAWQAIVHGVTKSQTRLK